MYELSKHTPGPWKVERESIDATGASISAYNDVLDENVIIADFYSKNAEADATLCTAASAMYEALEYALNNLRKNKNNGLGLAAIQKMKNALALAKGCDPE